MTNQQRRTITRTGQRPDTPPPADGIVFRISEAWLRDLLRLASDVTITDARWDAETGLVEFRIQAPAAPRDVAELLVSYRRLIGVRDPVHAESRWVSNAESEAS